MGAFNKAIPTVKGLALMAKAVAGVAELEFTKIAISDTVLSGDLSAKTSIGTIKQEQVASSVWKEGSSTISVSAGFSNENLAQGYYVRNIGLYAKDPTEGEILYSISIADEDSSSVDWMPPYAEVGISGLSVDLIVEISDASKVNVVVDGTAGATVAQILTLTSKVDAVTATATGLAKQYYDFVAGQHLKTYTDLPSIGLIVGSETIEGIAKALPNGSTLMTAVSTANSDIYPERGNGTLWVRYTDNSRAHFEYLSADTGRTYRGLYKGSTSVWSGWNDTTGQALLVDDLMGDYPVPTFVQWDANTLNTPYDHGFIDYPEGFALCFGDIATNQTIVAWAKGESTPECYMIRVVGGKVSDWEKFISSSGGRLKGKLLLGDGTGAIDANTSYSALQSTSSTSERRDLRVLRSSYGQVPVSEAVKLADVSGGVETLYNLYGDHNRAELSLARIVVKTYKGTGTWGSGDPNRIDFDGKPLFVVVTGTTGTETPYEGSLMFGYGSKYEAGALPASSGYTNVMTWGDTYVEWYSMGTDGTNVAKMQKNSKNIPYTVVAIVQ